MKNVWISIVSLIVVIALFVVIWFAVKNNNGENELVNNEVEENSVEVSETKVTDECINEWNDYNETIGSAQNANSNLNDENTRYLVKDEQGLIYVYYLDDSNEEYLYRKTDISTEYLSAEDIDNLEIGIEVIGLENLNKLLEDFE